ncbi:MAG: SDR family NAD(P)-dependent oxidoreductase [Gammaproteobacteria bacterium]|jgi:NAD(P)-dependent dehydrogenase (short-subunit alcohol dehydrogenase family)|nr:SDR family NAD(P)-dependent oxidoreductase [Gammaproteobacteria bacterium]MBP6053507.1 SDR family NAD(P)-dependent oxidoreductase [Pseudomonadales bacterium]MBK6584616.1 SDR family NAD(P)-dependent oxidoreductase [Gammaproteobacteria bacterium]MBK7170918.1 SDR family NAD(P)-dependent oxidoreductase [Gammaproteobacteria bacterium]MBK7519875.1 SDR family NAD(P)-dependent oxidoreductase [Gammaproteobacteria bacterium]
MPTVHASAEQAVANSPVWLITGCSSGLGRHIARAALARGMRVVVTARDVHQLDDFVHDYPANALALELDVTDARQIAQVVAESEHRCGGIDVLVNNAGYGYLAAIEEGEEHEVRSLFETNFFGALNMCRAVLPGMRARGRGRVINMSSQAGLMANAGTGYYSCSKYALEALSEALGKELKPFGIHVTAVAPGPFRTDWAGRSLRQTTAPLTAYMATVGERREFVARTDGTQPGDPARAAEAVLALAASEDPPAQLLLGRMVLESYRAKLLQVNAMLDAWESVTLGADFPPDS